MLQNELIDIIENSKTENELGHRLNNLYDEFRGGRNPLDILNLLTNPNELLVWHGCCICCEIVVKNSNDRNELINGLYNILKIGKDSANRERAFDALFGFYIDHNDIEGFNKICIEFKDDVLIEISDFAKNFLNDSRFRL